jgi:hypothetical protein
MIRELLKGRKFAEILINDFNLEHTTNFDVIARISNEVHKAVHDHVARHGMGGGVGSFLKEAYTRVKNSIKGPRDTIPPKVENEFKHDNSKIKKIEIARKPVVKGVQMVLDRLSNGNFSKAKKKLGYNDVYHNYLIVELEDGKKYKLEKNHVVEAKKLKDADLKAERYDIPINGHDLTIKGMLDNASKDDKEFYKYDPRNKNCQYFTKEMIERNSLIPSNEKAREVLKPQDGKQLINSLGKYSNLPKIITDVAGASDRLINGGRIAIGQPEATFSTVDELFDVINRH